MQVNGTYGAGPGQVGSAARDWMGSAACAGSDPEAMFVEGSAQHEAARVCTGCPVRLECLAEALDHRLDVGVWGGMTDRQRRALLRRRPEVGSWRGLLEAARARHQRAAAVRVAPAAAGGAR